MPTFHPNRSQLTLTVIVLWAIAGAVRCTTAQVVVNEFLFRDPDSRLEFIEILNVSAQAVDLGRLAISDERMSPVPIGGTDRTLLPGGFAVLVRDSVAFDARFSSARIVVSSWPALNNGGDAILLWTAGVPVDSVRFDNDWGSYGQSIERVDPNAPSATELNWKASTHPSGGTPGSQNSVFEPDRTAPALVEAEEWLDGSVIVYLSEPLHPASLPSTRIRFASGDRPRSSRLSLDNARIILEPWSDGDLTVLTIEGLTDASGNVAGTESISIARRPGQGDIILNEILFEPSADAFDGLPDQLEFVEIRSLTDHPLALRGMYLAGRPTEKGMSDTLRTEDRPMRLHPGGYGYFHATGSQQTIFREAFPSTPPDSVSVAARIGRQSLLLDNNGDTVTLRGAGDRLLDEVTYSSSWHLPERSVTRGVSLERISHLVPSESPANWTSSVSPEGATPGRVNSVALSNPGADENPLNVSPSTFSPDGDGWEDYVQIDIKSGRPAVSIAVWIFDSSGRLVRSLTDALAVGPEASIVWDGRDDRDHSLPPGVFIVYVEAVDTAAGDVQRFKRPVVLARFQ